MGLYSNVIFPRFYDRMMDRPFWGKHRRDQLSTARGSVLEIGVGTGLNLPHYPGHVEKITTVEPNPGMNRRLGRRSDQCGVRVDQRILSGENLPFDEASFDCVVTTMTLCSVSDVSQVLAEIYRVLRPGGRYLFLEHGVSPDAKIARWQKRLNRFQRVFADGCILDMPVPEAITAQPFSDFEVSTFYMKKTPRTHGYMYQGVAVK